jgi:hypothetical protein
MVSRKLKHGLMHVPTAKEIVQAIEPSVNGAVSPQHAEMMGATTSRHKGA